MVNPAPRRNPKTGGKALLWKPGYPSDTLAGWAVAPDSHFTHYRS